MCFHHCGTWHTDLDPIFPSRKTRYTIESYIDFVLFSAQYSHTITKTSVRSVKYCRTRGPPGMSYPFLIIRLRHPEFWNCGSLMKLEGETLLVGVEARGDSPERKCCLTMGKADQSVRALVGTWRYHTLETVSFPYESPELAEILTLVELADQQDRTREGFPEVLFFAIKNLFEFGKITRGVKNGSTDAAHRDEAKIAVVDAFPARREKYVCFGRGIFRILAKDPEGPDAEAEELEAEDEISVECALEAWIRRVLSLSRQIWSVLGNE
ncbi:hypothetical protein DFH06DRAFT_1337425 [Mycena polygramma]|nr:hypothetical protein DFH06DRAFT_1337425 [Mycena polygramma]